MSDLFLSPLCVIYIADVVRNQVGLDADAIWNEEGNNVLQGLELSTRNIVSFLCLIGLHRKSRYLHKCSFLNC